MSTYTCPTMEAMVASLEPLLERTDIIGYAAARNTRTLRNELATYQEKRDALVLKHGSPETDEEGIETGTVSINSDSEGFSAFVEELAPLAAVEHEPRLMTLPYSEAIGNLSGKQLLDLDWMFVEED